METSDSASAAPARITGPSQYYTHKRICQDCGQYEQGEENFSKAFEIASKIGEQPSRLAELQFWRMECLYMRGTADELVEAGEAGLALLGENLVCPQTACIFSTMGWSYSLDKRDYAKAEEYWSKHIAAATALTG